ncbi:MAG TPA: hypothetical protein VMS56_03070 [Thermoanaerobaculia bacterium]|nr:hypothetical protein [Thermoanaerobaculia bacterium]
MSPDEIRTRIESRFPELGEVGRDAWIVGGAIRDAILGRLSPDLDLAVGDAAAAAVELGRRTGGKVVALGRERFAAWRVIAGPRSFDLSELTGGEIGRDLARRDFTINAMAIPVGGAARLEDPYDGRIDLGRRMVRMISPENLRDDPLRVVKAARMAAVLSFTIEEETLAACRDLAGEIDTVAPERIGVEIDAMFGAGSPGTARLALAEIGLDRGIFGRELPAALDRLKGGDAVLALAVIYRGASDREVRDAVRRLRWPAARREAVRAVFGLDRALHGLTPDPGRIDLALFDAGEEAADRTASLLEAFGETPLCALVRARLDARGAELFATRPLLSGEEISAATSLPPGPAIGRLKRALLEAQIRNEVLTRQDAERHLKALMIED